MGLLLLVRHGQASFGADDYDVLSPLGWKQGEHLGDYLRSADVVPIAIVRGDMRRHRETLESAAAQAGWSLDAVVVDPRWDEFDHLSIVAGHPGLDDEPLDRPAFQRVFEEATNRWAAGEGSYDESYADFRGRVSEALSDAAALAGSGRTGVVVTSGGVIAAVAAALIDPAGTDDAAFARRWQRLNVVTVNSSVTRVVVGSTGARLLSFNEHHFLPPPLVSYR